MADHLHPAIDIPGEEWRPIPGYEGIYEASSHGRIRSLPRRLVRDDGWHKTYRGHVLRQHVDRTGRKAVGLSKDNRRRTLRVHLLVARAFHRGSGLVRHLDGDPLNNRADNLAWGTIHENRADTYKHGTHIEGSAHANAKLTEADVARMRRMRRDGLSFRRIAAWAGVADSNVRRILSGRMWAHVTEQDERYYDLLDRLAAAVDPAYTVRPGVVPEWDRVDSWPDAPEEVNPHAGWRLTLHEAGRQHPRVTIWHDDALGLDTPNPLAALGAALEVCGG